MQNHLVLFWSFLVVVTLATAGAAAAKVDTDGHGCTEATLPRLEVPHCRRGIHGVVRIHRRLVTLHEDFPATRVQLCYTDRALKLTFQAREERSYRVHATYGNNDPSWEWTVLEAFIATGEPDPTHYLELEVAPNNVLSIPRGFRTRTRILPPTRRRLFTMGRPTPSP